MNDLGKLQKIHSEKGRAKILLAVVVLTFLVTQTACDDCPSSDKGCVNGTVVWKQDKTKIAATQVLLCRYININSGFGESTGLKCFAQVAETVTNEDGVYSFQNVPPGKYSIMVKIPDSDKYICLIKKDQNDLFKVQSYAEEFLVSAGQTTYPNRFEISN
jgi:hypothetical protein